MKKQLIMAASALAILNAAPALAESKSDIEKLRQDIHAMKSMYESRIEALENRLADMEKAKSGRKRARPEAAEQAAAGMEPAAGAPGESSIAQPATAHRRVNDNSFNPSIGVILQGEYNSFSENATDIAGFAIGEEAERAEEGFTLDETELNFAANVDNLFRGSATVALHEHGHGVEVEIEEAYIETLSLASGLNLKAGRFFSDIGYLNGLHTHADDFADRPLPYRAFLNKAYNDDGVQATWILPTEFYSEIGGGAFQGDDFPAGHGEGSDIGAWTAFGRIGGDIGNNTAWRLGLSTLHGDGIEREGNEETVEYKGDSDLYIVDFRTTWAPTGNNREEEVILQGEYFYRDEDGTYEDTAASTGAIAYDENQSGWYAQGVYKFRPQWRLGLRYAELYAGDVPAGLVGSALDDGGHDPWAGTAMLDWTNSEFSRLRLQYSREELADNAEDDQITLQYIMSIGAHGAHPF